MIDYHNWFISFTDLVRLFPVTSNFREFISGLATIKLRIGRVRNLKKFQEENYNLTRKFYLYNSLKKNPPICDKYVCGSDQIWNPIITGGVFKMKNMMYMDLKIMI